MLDTVGKNFESSRVFVVARNVISDSLQAGSDALKAVRESRDSTEKIADLSTREILGPETLQGVSEDARSFDSRLRAFVVVTHAFFPPCRFSNASVSNALTAAVLFTDMPVVCVRYFA